MDLTDSHSSPASRLRGAERTRRWRVNNLDDARTGTRESVRKWREANPGAANEVNRRSRQRMKDLVFDRYGRACACCGATEKLTIDHVGGGGKTHRLQIFGRNQAGAQFYSWLVRNGLPEGYQALCRPCNSSKADDERCTLDHAQVTA